MPFLITIGSSLFGLFGKKVTAGTAKVAGIAALIALAVLGVVLFFVIHDHNVIKNHDAGINAKVSNAVVGADRYAGDQKAARDQTFSNSQAEIGNAVGKAAVAHPAEVKKPVGPASQSYYDELRRQQKQKQKGKHK
jgi:amino acid transporter